MDKCPKCGGEVKVLTRSLEFWGGMDCVAVENRDSLKHLKAKIAAMKDKLKRIKSKSRFAIQSNSICDYCVEGGFCGKQPSMSCFEGIKIMVEYAAKRNN